MGVFKEFNDQRAHQRINAPIFTFIEGKMFENKDWSAGGIGLIKPDNCEIIFEKEKEYDCKIVLPIKGSSIYLDGKVIFKNEFNSILGFTFKEFSNTNKRVVRNYIQMIIEGADINPESFMTDLATPNIKTPIIEPITLDTDHKVSLKKAFVKKTRRNIIIGAVLGFLVGIIIIYNFVVMYQTKGITTGNFIKYNSDGDGQVMNLNLKVGDNVLENTVLFNTVNYLSDEEKKTIENQIKEYYNIDTVLAIKSSLLKELEYQSKDNNYLKSFRKEVENSKILYSKNIIPLSDLHLIENKYEFEKDNSSKSKMDILKNISILKQEISNLKTKKDNYWNFFKDIDETTLIKNKKVYTAKEPGIIHTVKHQNNVRVLNNSLILIQETNNPSYALILLNKKDSHRFNIGDKAYVYSNYSKQYHVARISSLGYSSTDTLTNSTMEVSLNETIVRLEFDKMVSFPLNHQVEVKIINDNFFFTPFFEYFWKKR